MASMVCPICKKTISEREKYQAGEQVIHQLCKHVMCGSEQLPGRVIEMSGKYQAIVRLGTSKVAYHISEITPYKPDALKEEEINQFEEEAEPIA